MSRKIKEKITHKNITKFTNIATIVLVFIVYVVADFVKVNGTATVNTGFWYWAFIVINLILVATIMVVVRAMQKQKLLDSSVLINDNLLFVNRARKIIIGNAYSKKLNTYLEEVNEENKYQAYLRKVNNKLSKLNNNRFLRESTKEKKMKTLEALLEVKKEQVLKQYVKFKKVTKTGLFSGVDGKIISIDEYDISTHNARDISEMVGYKALLVFLFSAVSGTIAVQFLWFGIEGLFSTFLKLLSLTIACASAISQATDFVNYNVMEAMTKRIEILSNFVNGEPELKERMIEAKQADEDEIQEKKDKEIPIENK